MTKITWGTGKTNISQAPPLRSLELLIQGGPPAIPRDSYQLGNIIGKHMVHSSFSLLTCGALCIALVSQEKQRKHKLKIQKPKSYQNILDSPPAPSSQCNGVLRLRERAVCSTVEQFHWFKRHISYCVEIGFF